jgi:predicted metalloprotease
MANWNNLGSRGDVEDRRGLGNTARLSGAASIVGIALLLLVNYFNGGSVIDVLPQLLETQVGQQQNITTTDFDGADEYEVFASTVLGSTNDMWTELFAKNNLTYEKPTLVLFRGGTQSSCGGATSDVGPHYCPLDHTIYLDETFFDELQRRFGATGGDVAEAYVIAHEVGHHVQEELNTLEPDRSNEDSIKTELQADCYAGLWAYSIKDLGVFEPDEIQEALDAAAAVGDDRIQKASTGRVNPESWTHGSSAQRVNAFNTGFEHGTLASCSNL